MYIYISYYKLLVLVYCLKLRRTAIVVFAALARFVRASFMTSQLAHKSVKIGPKFGQHVAAAEADSCNVVQGVVGQGVCSLESLFEGTRQCDIQEGISLHRFRF